MGDGIEGAIQLAHGDGLGVDDRDLHLVLLHQTLVWYREGLGGERELRGTDSS